MNISEYFNKVMIDCQGLDVSAVKFIELYEMAAMEVREAYEKGLKEGNERHQYGVCKCGCKVSED